MTNGKFTSIDFPDANTTDAWKISDASEIIGDWSVNGALQSGSVAGYFLYEGQFSSHAVPGAVITASRDINSKGQVVGIYWDKKFNDHGFVLDGGTYSSFDYPSSTWTDGNAINDHGLIVGSYSDSAGAEHGYVAAISND